MVREVGGCGVRVLPEVQRNHVKKKEELKRKKEQIQQVVIDLLIINISVSTRYKKNYTFHKRARVPSCPLEKPNRAKDSHHLTHVLFQL